MTTFRKLAGNINVPSESKEASSLDVWFKQVADIPIKDLSVKDLCRAIRQGLYIDLLMPRVMAVLTADPLAGEYYDGELISALSMIKEKDIKDHKDVFIEIKQLLNEVTSSNIDNDLIKDIEKINKIFI